MFQQEDKNKPYSVSQTGEGKASGVSDAPTEIDYIIREQVKPIIKEEIKPIYYVLIGIVIFTVVSFLVGFFLISIDSIKEKEWFLKYTDLYENYLERNLELNNKINKQQIEIGNLENELEVLKVKNYLK